MEIGEASFTQNEELLARLPKLLIGFRGQASKFNEETILKGFDKPHEYFLIDLRKFKLSDIKQQWTNIVNSFNFSIRCGDTDYPKEITGDLTVSQALDFYKEHPEVYSSILVLTFPRLTDFRFTMVKGTDKDCGWYKHKLPAENIAGIIYPKKEDFLEFENKLKEDSSLDKDFGNFHQYINGKMLTRFLEFLVHLKEASLNTTSGRKKRLLV